MRSFISVNKMAKSRAICKYPKFYFQSLQTNQAERAYIAFAILDQSLNIPDKNPWGMRDCSALKAASKDQLRRGQLMWLRQQENPITKCTVTPHAGWYKHWSICSPQDLQILIHIQTLKYLFILGSSSIQIHWKSPYLNSLPSIND